MQHDRDLLRPQARPAVAELVRRPRGRRLPRLLVVAVGILLAVLGAASPASAHARLRAITPPPAATVAVQPDLIRLTFSEVLEPGQSQVLVTGPDGQPVPGVRTSIDPADATVLRTQLPPGQPRGTYVVGWRVLSVDGHPVAASYRFAIGAPSSPLTATTSSGLSPSLLSGTGRALDDVGLLVLVGVTAFPLLVRGSSRRRSSRALVDWLPGAGVMLRRLRPLLAGALGVALCGNALLAVDTVAQARGFAVSDIGAHLADVADFLRSSRTGHLLGGRELGLLVLGAALAVSYRGRAEVDLPGRRAAVAHLSGTMLLLLTVAVSSHAGSTAADRWLSVGIDWSHLVAAGIWTGGLLSLALAGLPAARAGGQHDPEAAAAQAGLLTARFSDVAQLCMLVVAATGTYAALLHVSGLTGLGLTTWGAVLMAKLALWLTVLLVATANATSLVPRISRRAAAASSRLAACGDLAGAIRFEVAAALALIAVAAVLAGTAPPDQLT